MTKSQHRTVYLRFPDEAAMLLRIRGLLPGINKAGLSRAKRTARNGQRRDIDLLFGTGLIYRQSGTDEEPVFTLSAGIHVNLLVEDDYVVPAPMRAYVVDPGMPKCLFA